MNNDYRTEEYKEHMRKIMTGRSCPWNDAVNKDPEKIRKTVEKTRGMKRTKETCENISNALIGKYVGEDNPHFKGYWITPFGRFVSLDEASETSDLSTGCIRKRCLKNDNVVSLCSMSKDKKLTNDMLGKSWKELGYSFEAVVK